MRARAQLQRRGVWCETRDDGSVVAHHRGDPADAVHGDPARDRCGGEDVAGAGRRARCRGARRSRFDGLGAGRGDVPRTGRARCAERRARRPRGSRDACGTRGRSVRDRGWSERQLRRRSSGLACDSGVRLAIDERGKTLDVGRRTRTIPPALRRAIVDRDQGTCRFPGCTHQGRLQIHHGRHWAKGGRTEKPNLILVCLYHHKVLHEGGWNVTGSADGALTFIDPHGRPMPEVSLPPPRTDAREIRRENVALGVVIKADTIESKQDPFERLDLRHAVDSLWLMDPPSYN